MSPDLNVTDLGPICEGCGERTARPTWAGMDPFCPACVEAEEVAARRAQTEAHKRERCGACGHFLPRDSFYTNRCSDCWGPEDEFLW